MSHRAPTKKTHKIHSAVNPVDSIFNPDDIPKNVMNKLDLENELRNEAKVNTFEVLNTWLHHKYPTLTKKQDCKDVISGKSEDSDRKTQIEIKKGSLLSLLGYAMPYYMPQIALNIHQKNAHFMDYIASYVSESTFIAYRHMDTILEGEIKHIPLSNDAQMAGFYIRTPIEVWKGKKKIYRIPPWERREDLLNYTVAGNVNLYVMRNNLKDGFECYVMFRGSSNEFNAIHQYGNQMQNTQIYNIPKYDPIEEKLYPEGSDTIPLFHAIYIDMINNVMPHILQCLDWLNALDPACKRIVVTGHSMAGSLVLNFCYLLKIFHPKWWDKCEFRSYAAPMCCNDAAVLKIEQWLIDSMHPNKFIEVVNTDDLVNLQYLLGGKKGIKESVKQGTNQIGSWMVSNYWATHNKPEDPKKTDPETTNRMLRIVQLYPEIAFSAFLYGALEAQVQNIPEEKNAGFRIGQREEEMKLWGSKALKSTYNDTLKLFYCKRRIDWQSEYLGKSHSNYVDINMSVLWAPLRMYEDNLYNYYAKHGLKHNNSFILLPIFPKQDLQIIEPLVQAYKPPVILPSQLKLSTLKKKTNSKK
jgi:hypothetical protein